VRFKSFDEARIFVRSLGIKSAAEWRGYCKSGNKLKDIPSNPESYGNQFKGYGDWPGTGKVHTKRFRSFKEARQFVYIKNSKHKEMAGLCISHAKVMQSILIEKIISVKLIAKCINTQSNADKKSKHYGRHYIRY
jgi:hypothetical protein